MKDVGRIWKENTNMEEKLVKILNEMADYLNISQMKKLQETGKREIILIMGQMVFKTMSLIIFLMMNLYYLQKMVVTLAQKKNLLHIEFQENAGSITMLMF